MTIHTNREKALPARELHENFHPSSLKNFLLCDHSAGKPPAPFYQNIPEDGLIIIRTTGKHYVRVKVIDQEDGAPVRVRQYTTKKEAP